MKKRLSNQLEKQIEQVQETIQTHTETVVGSSEDHEEGNPWPHLKKHKQRRADSVTMECKLCLPKMVEVAAYIYSASNLRKHVS